MVPGLFIESAHTGRFGAGHGPRDHLLSATQVRESSRLLLAEFSRSSFRSLPMALRPTLLVNQPYLARTMTSLLRASNYPGLFVPGNRGTVLDIACSKAVYCGMEGGADLWDDTALHLALPPARSGLPPLVAREQDEIANRFQPQMLMYRCCNFPRVREPGPAADRPTFPNSEAARNLAACIQGEPDFAQTVIPLLHRQEQDALARRSCDVNSAVVEVVWAQSHEAKEIAVSRITELTNALLRCRGETSHVQRARDRLETEASGLFSPQKQRRHGFEVSRETRLLVHQLARHYGLTFSAIDGCGDCASQVTCHTMTFVDLAGAVDISDFFLKEITCRTEDSA